MRVIAIILIIGITFSCDTADKFAVPEENYFVKFYGEQGDQEGIDFIVNTDGTIVMVGTTEKSLGKKQIYVVKVEANGQVLWQRSIGLPDKNDFAKDIELHPDGRIVIAGETEMGTDNRDVYVRTLSQDGALLDSARYGLNNGSIDTDEEVNSITIINGGGAFPPGFIVTGSTTFVLTSDVRDLHDAMFLRFDNSLKRILETGASPIWGPPKWGYNSDDVAYKIVEIDFDTYYVFGYSNRIFQQFNGDYNFWYFALSGDGKTKTGENYFGKTSENEVMTAAEITFNQAGVRYILSGTATASGNSAQSYVAALPPTLSFSSGDILRERNPTNLGLNENNLLRVAVKGALSDSFLMLSSENQTDNFNLSFVKLKSDLSADSEPLIFGGVDNDFSGSLTELQDGRILISGTMIVGGLGGQKKMVLMKLNSVGKITE
jgi:hypothetical protein